MEWSRVYLKKLLFYYRMSSYFRFTVVRVYMIDFYVENSSYMKILLESLFGYNPLFIRSLSVPFTVCLSVLIKRRG